MGERFSAGDQVKTVELGGGLIASRLVAPASEVSTRPSEAHIFSYALGGTRRHRQWRDGKPIIDGVLPGRTVNVVRSGEEPRALLSEPVELLHIYIPHSRLRALASDEGLIVGGDLVELHDPRFQPDHVLEALGGQIAASLATVDQLDRLLRDHLANALCVRLLQRWSNLSSRWPADLPVLSRKQASMDRRLRRAIDYLDACAHEDVGIEELAALVGLSATHLTSLFKQGTGQTPHRWLMGRRIERACELLGSSDQSVTEIAHTCGFCSSQHLAAAFRSRMGVSPTEYRRERNS